MKHVPRCLFFWSLAVFPAMGAIGESDCWPGFILAREFSEQVREIRFACGARAVLVAPDAAHFDPNLPTQLIIYATPNGNTIEQTLGCRANQGLDWHFDIQHAAAQTRFWRSVHTSENVVLACVQADMRSWPTWRQKYANSGALIHEIVAALIGQVPSTNVNIVLTGHSGGGSFITGYINAVDEIPPIVRRIAYLDANYSYSTEEQHGRKFVEWLERSGQHQFIVVAYDDREIELDGKKVVGPTGGTFRASHRLLDFLRDQESIEQDRYGEFDRYTAIDGRLRVLIHPNPENKILHTRLVGEMNGLAYVLAVGTAAEATWGALGAPRVYGDWVQPAPFEPAEWVPAAPAIPPRRDGAVTGSQFSAQWNDAPAAEREVAALSEFLAGNVPNFLRRFVEIQLGGNESEHEITLRVMPDYLAIGTDDDFLRLPITPATAQCVADAYGCLLPTRKLVDDVHRCSALKLAPQPLTEDREALATFAVHDELIEAQLVERQGAHGQLLSGIKKDVVISNQVHARPGHVAIYGWHKEDGTPIQPLTTVHVDWYVDYSHGVRLVDQHALLDATPVRVSDLLADVKLYGLLSDEGPIKKPFYAPVPAATD